MSSPHPTRPAASNRKTAAAIIIGSALEWYDFYLYAAMAALVFGSVFFPSGNEITGILASFATFAVGFLARPFGGMFFGVLGDRIGRRRVLAITFVLMGGASGCIGLLPSYASIGLVAPIMLVLLRLLQGLAAGAELSSAFAYSYEYAGAKSKGRTSSWPAFGTSIGLVASSATVAVLSWIGDDFLVQWGWRIPFVAAFALVLVGYFVRRRLPETPDFEQHAAKRTQQERRPLRTLVTSHWRSMLVVTVLSTGHNATSYMYKTFALTYLTTFLALPASVGTTGVTIASVLALLTTLVAGRLADRVGARTMLLISGSSACAIAFPFFWLVDTRASGLVWLALILASGFIVPVNLATQGGFMASQFPVEVRAAGLGTAREVGSTIGGGLAPLAAVGVLALSATQSTWGISLLFIVAGLCTVLGAAFDRSRSVRAAERKDATGSPQPDAGALQ